MSQQSIMLFNNANLALAAYASLVAGPTADQTGALQDAAAGMSSKQALEFAARYPTIVSQFNDTAAEGGLGTSFSATVFKDTAGNVTVAIRGTAELTGTSNDLFPTDANIALNGTGYDQIVAMYNWWLRESNSEGQLVSQYRLRTYPIVGPNPPANSLELYTQTKMVGITPIIIPVTRVVLESAPPVQASGRLFDHLAADPNVRVDLAGHSLGGHLAMAFNKLFPNIVEKVTAFNSPGFTDTPTNQQFFSRLGGVVPTQDNSGNVTNVIADQASVGQLPWSAIAGKHSIPGTLINVAIENQHGDEPFDTAFGSRNHSQAALTDSLAVYRLLATFAPSMTTNDYKAILAAAATGTAASYERIVDVLEVLIGTDNRPMPVGNNQRESLYSAITVLHTAIDDRALFGTVSILPITTVDAASLVQAANGLLPDAAPDVALAYRYALKKLNPFIVTGNAGIYDVHNLNGELELHDPVARTGTLTPQWIADRAAFLTWKNTANTGDQTVILRPEFSGDGRKRFDDLASGYSIALTDAVLPPNDDTARRFVFGGDNSDNVTGGSKADRLYGSGGTDYLEGRKGNDYLEGGAGLDVYQYSGRAGLGVDNDDEDTIRDTDGKGVLRYTFFDNPAPTSTVIVDAFAIIEGTKWRSADGKFVYTKSTDADGRIDLRIAIDGDSGGNLILKDWREGDFGIRLRGSRAEPVIGNSINSDSATISDTVENDLIIAGASDNHVQATQGGNDKISGGSGRDRIDAGPGNDLVEGGAGTVMGGDIVDGGAGDDVLYGDAVVAWDEAIVTGRTAAGTGLKGDWLSGGIGSDVLVGGNANDVLVGGRGADLLIGGGGDDNIGGGAQWVATSLDWSYQDLGNNIRFFAPISGEDAPTDDVGDVAYGGAGKDYLWGGYGDDVLFGEADNDYLGGQWGDDILAGGDGADILEGDDADFTVVESGSDYLDGGAGNDELFGYGGDDVLIGGAGNDVLVGGAGRDIYVFNKGDGADTVFDESQETEKSILVRADNFDSSKLKIFPGSLILEFGDGDSVHLTNFDVYDPNSSPAFERLTFTDGISMSFEDVIAIGFNFDGAEENDDGHDAAHPVLIGTAFNDRIRGHGGNDILIALQGNDTLDGGTGSDRLFGDSGDDILMGGDDMDALIGGDGDDVLHGGMAIDYAWGGAGNDYLEGGGGQDNLFGELGDDTYVFDEQDAVRDFLGATTIDFTGNERPEDIELRFLFVNSLPVYALKRTAETGGDLFAFGMGITLSSADQLAGMTFADGTVLTGQDMLHEMLINGTLASSTAGDDEILGYADSESISGGEGNDVLFGYRGSDLLLGDAGNDYLDGGSGSDQLYGGIGDDTLAGGTGNDELHGTEGSDLYIFSSGDGQDLIIDSGDTGATDVLLLSGILEQDVTITHEANGDLKISVTGSSDSVTISGYHSNPANRIERIGFDDGTVIEATALDAIAVLPIEGTGANDILVGTHYADTINGYDGADTLDGKGGEDILVGGTGVDTYKLNLVAGNALLVEDGAETSVIRIPDGLKFSQLQVQRSGDDLVLGVQGSQGTVTVPGYYTGQVNWTVTTSTGGLKSLGELITYLEQNAQPPQTVQELEQAYLDDAHLQYEIYLASFNALGGIRINEQPFSDAATIFRSPPFSETEENGLIFLNIADITAGGAANVLNFKQSGVVIADAGAGDDLINNQGFGFSDSSIGTIGSFLNGNQGDDKILGSWAADTLIGSAGDDYIAGSDGNDTYYVFGIDSGVDVIDEVISDVNLPGGHFAFAGARDSTDTLQLIGVNYEDVSFTKGVFNASQVGGTGVFSTLDIWWEAERHVSVILPNPGDPYLSQHPGESVGIETTRFADGTVLTLGGMLALVPSLHPIIFGSSGNDFIMGTPSPDTIYAGSGDDSISGHSGVDVIYGEAGNDNIVAFGPGSSLFGGSGNDTLNSPPLLLSAGPGVDCVLDGGPGDDLLNGFFGSDQYVFGYGGGSDTIREPSFVPLGRQDTDTLQFLPGVQPSDVITSQAGTDLVIALTGSLDKVTLKDWFLQLENHVERIIFSDGTNWDVDAIFGQLPVAAIQGTSSNDILSGTRGRNEINGLDGNDRLTGHNNQDVLSGGSGDDELSGALGDDILVGGTGNDVLSGGEGSDIYQFALGDKRDTISEADLSAPTDMDVLRLGAGIVPDDLELTLDSDLHIRVSGTTDEITILGWNDGSQKIERIEFADGTVWDLAAIEANILGELITSSGGGDVATGSEHSETIQGTSGNEWLIGGGGNDVLVGGRGNDLLLGETGADTYMFNVGDGVDTIYDPSTPGESNAVMFGDGITPDSLSLGLGSLLVRVGTDGDVLHFQSFDPANPYITRDVDVFRFADGSALSYEQLLARGFDILGTAGDDELGGTAIADHISGFAGNDSLDAGAGDDVLDGGTGGDVLTGGSGNDTYLFGLGSESDFIEEASGDLDSVLLGDGITPEKIRVSRSGSTLTLRIDGAADELALHQEVKTGFLIEQVRFADGTIWDAATLESKVMATNMNTPPVLSVPLADRVATEDQAFSFTVPANTFTDADAGDTLGYSATLADGSALPSWLSFDPATRVFNGTPQNDDVGAVSVKVVAIDRSNISAFDVFDLTIVNTNDAPTLVNLIADQTGNQNAPFAFQLPEGTFADVDVGDRLTLGATLADGSPLPGWLAFNSVDGSFNGTPTEVDVGDWAIAVTATDPAGASVSGDFALSVSDASVVNETYAGTRYRDAIVTGFANDWVEAGDGNDLVRSGAGRDTLLGGKGHDRLEGGVGNDAYVHERRGGHDIIWETGGRDVVRLGEGIAASRTRLYRSHDDLIVDLHGADGKVTIEGWFASDAAKVETIEFADGTAWDEDYIRNHLTRGQPMQEWDDGENEHYDDHGFEDRDQPDVKRDEDDGRDKREPQRGRDRMAKLLEAYLAHEPGYDFEAYAREVERGSRHEPALDPQEIAARWRKIDRYLKDMEDDPDGDARGAAGDWRFDAVGLMVEGWSGGGVGYAGPAGLARGAVNLRTLEGLREGFHQLRT